MAFSALALLVLLSACVHGQQAPAPGADRCCANPQRQPRWLVAVVEPAAPVVGRIIGHVAWRPGYLSDPTIQAEIMDGLRVLDMIIVSSKGRLSGHTIPGLFFHAAVHVGSEDELKALGMWTHPAVAPHHEAIRRGARFIEADMRGVHLSPPSIVLNTDRAVVLRPQISTPGWRQRAMATLFGDLGRKFDFNFDAGRADRLFCVELICRAMPELRLPRDRAYGRETILPDRVVHDAARGKLPLRFVAYVAGDKGGGVRHPGRGRLITDIEDAWP